MSSKFEKTTLEALKSGCIVLGGADGYSLKEYSRAIDAPELPILKVETVDDLVDSIKYLEKNPKYKAKLTREISEYAANYLSHDRLSQIFNSIYKKSMGY